MRKRLIRAGTGCLTLFMLLFLLLLARIATYSLDTSPTHLKAKRDYLKMLSARPKPKTRRPNVVVIVFDDLGIGDLGAYGSRSIQTPNIDRIAQEGVLYTQFYAASPVCSPSRAALMTGRYPIHNGLTHVVWPPRSPLGLYRKIRRQKIGLPPDEITLADAFQASGYRTGLIGKWHLGGSTPSLPLEFGFDHYFGVLCSNDQHPMHLYRQHKIIAQHPIDQTKLTQQYTHDAIEFIKDNAKRPFFLYLAHTFPHAPLHVNPKRLGHSNAGKYGDVIEELDDSTGKIIKTLAQLKLSEHTLVLLTSDNGPWHQGSPGPHRGRKWEVFEGGVRVPLIVRWPRHISAQSIDKTPNMNIDIFPTLLHIAKIPLPKDRLIDGKKLSFPSFSKTPEKTKYIMPSSAYPSPTLPSYALPPALRNAKPKPKPKTRTLFFYWRKELYAIRHGNFKYHRRHRMGSFNPIYPLPWNPHKGPWLFDLKHDPNESYDATAKHPKRAASLKQMMHSWTQQIAQNPRGWLPTPK